MAEAIVASQYSYGSIFSYSLKLSAGTVASSDPSFYNYCGYSSFMALAGVNGLFLIENTTSKETKDPKTATVKLI